MEREEKIQILQDIVRIKTVESNEEELALYIKTIFDRFGIKSEIVNFSEGRSSIYAEMGKEGGKTLGLNANLDVDGIKNYDLWDYPPFGGEIHDGNLYGRGSSNMKSGLAALVLAMCETVEENIDLDGKIKFFGTVGDVDGLHGAKQLVDLGYGDNIDGIIVADPSDNRIMFCQTGSLNYTVVSKGKRASTKIPFEGVNAINNIMNFLARTHEKLTGIGRAYTNAYLGGLMHSFTAIEGGNGFSAVPDYVELKGNVRTVPEFDNEKVIETLQNLVNEENRRLNRDLSLSIGLNVPPLETKMYSDLIMSFQKGIFESAVQTGLFGVTDAVEFARVNPNLEMAIYGPGHSILSSMPNEYVKIEDYLNMIITYKITFQEYLNKRK